MKNRAPNPAYAFALCYAAMVSQGRIKLFANTTFPLVEVKKAFEAVSNRQTIGKVVLTP